MNIKALASITLAAGLIATGSAANAHGGYHQHGHRDAGYYYDHHDGRRAYECHAGSNYEGCYRRRRRRRRHHHHHSGFGVRIDDFSIYGIF